ncbi:MAG: peptide chain release factor 2 [bacterium]
MQELQSKSQNLQDKLRQLTDCLDISGKEKEIGELEKEIAKPEFWEDKDHSKEVSQRLFSLKEERDEIQEIIKEVNDITELAKIAGEDEAMADELRKKIIKAEKEIEKEKIKIFLSGKHDKGNALLQVSAGTGGQDSEDWATMLLRMYERYCENQGFKAEILEQSFGEAGGPEGRIGTKHVTMEVKGRYAYGMLRKETGVHRLVRISPFSAKALRHTSFAAVEVLPGIEEKELEITINPDEIKIDFFHASGPGGQNVNKRETAVRITHLPTGIVVSCQVERSQLQNRERAMKILLAKIYQQQETKRQKEMKEIKGEAVSATWGNQIRTYVLHPYKMVKDLRTDVETSNAEAVLDGDLNQFIEAEIFLK